MEGAEIRLLGQRIPVKADTNDPELTQEVIDLVAKRVESVEKRLKGHHLAHEVTLLALLDLAEEYVRARRRTEEYKTEVERRSDEIARIIDEGPGGENQEKDA